jgi:5'-methylthioadenosine phosphorylase
MKIGVLSGHPLPNLIQDPEPLTVETSYGSVPVEVARLDDHELLFLRRHGERNLPPHKVNYRGNIQAFAVSHVDCVFAVGTVGSMKQSIKPGDIVLPHDFIDLTKTRPYTFYDDRQFHVDMTNAFCPGLRDVLVATAKTEKSVKVHEKGVYLTTEGPRLETPAEIKCFSQFADIVGMTLVPEVVLAREKGMCYASVCVVCNMAAGLQKQLSADEIGKVYRKREAVVANICKYAIRALKETRECDCKNYGLKADL